MSLQKVLSLSLHLFNLFASYLCNLQSNDREWTVKIVKDILIMCVVWLVLNRKSCIRSTHINCSCCAFPNCIHVLGGKERIWLQLPRPYAFFCTYDSHSILYYSGDLVFFVRTLHLQNSHKLIHPNLIILFHHDCVPDIFPIWTSCHNYLWSCWVNYIQLVHCVRYWQPDQAIRLWWIHMGVCGSLLGYSEPFPFIVTSFGTTVKLTHIHTRALQKVVQVFKEYLMWNIKISGKHTKKYTGPCKMFDNVNGQMLNSWIRWYLL